jgi:hypothetical protein
MQLMPICANYLGKCSGNSSRAMPAIIKQVCRLQKGALAAAEAS